MSATKFCIDCRYCSNKDPHKCGAPESYSELDLVTGRATQEFQLCSSLRRLPRFCGEEGKWFKEVVAPPTFLQKMAALTRAFVVLRGKQ